MLHGSQTPIGSAVRLFPHLHQSLLGHQAATPGYASPTRGDFWVPRTLALKMYRYLWPVPCSGSHSGLAPCFRDHTILDLLPDANSSSHSQASSVSIVDRPIFEQTVARICRAVTDNT